MSSGGKKLFLVVALTCLVFAGLAGYGDVREVGRHLAGFPLWPLLAALGLALANYLLRFLRWAYYLRVLRLDVPIKVSLLVFLAGLAMTVTPGKLGELLKCYLLRDRASIPLPASAPIVLMERITDLLSVAAMALLGLALLPVLVSLVVGSIFVGVALVVFFVAARQTDWILRLPVIRRWREDLASAREGFRALSRPVPIAVATSLALVAWASEGVALWVVMWGLDVDIGFLVSLPVYAGSVLAGAVTTLPGGLVGTEGAMVTLLQQLGTERDFAAAGTLLVRLVTLWFAVAVGLTALGCLHWNRRRLQDSAPSAVTKQREGVARTGDGSGAG